MFGDFLTFSLPAREKRERAFAACLLLLLLLSPPPPPPSVNRGRTREDEEAEDIQVLSQLSDARTDGPTHIVVHSLSGETIVRCFSANNWRFRFGGDQLKAAPLSTLSFWVSQLIFLLVLSVFKVLRCIV